MQSWAMAVGVVADFAASCRACRACSRSCRVRDGREPGAAWCRRGGSDCGPRHGFPSCDTADSATNPRPGQVDALLAALRTWRDRAMAEAMVLGGLRRCEVLGLRLADLQVAGRRVFIAEGKGGHQRLIPVSGRFFASVASYLDLERPAEADTDAVFVVLKGRRRGQPLTAAGLDEILDLARQRAGLASATCHQLRHTCLTRLREAGMALEAVQAQAGHRSIESTRIYCTGPTIGWVPYRQRRRRSTPDAPWDNPPGPPTRLSSVDCGWGQWLPVAPVRRVPGRSQCRTHARRRYGPLCPRRAVMRRHHCQNRAGGERGGYLARPG